MTDERADRPRRARRRWVWWAGGVVGVIVVVLVAAPPLLGSFVKGKLVETVEQRTDATLRVGSVTYLPPYGVRVEDASFVVPDPEKGGEVEMVRVKRLELKLAKLPLGSGPLVVERVTIESPVARLIQTKEGLLGVGGLVKDGRAAADRVKKRLSEVFELRHLSVKDGSFSFEDRTEPGSVPLVWRGLNASTETRPKSQGVYTYDLNVENGTLATLKSVGTVDIDNLVIDARSMALDVQVAEGGTESAVPAQVQKLLAEYDVRGRLGVEGSGRAPLKDLSRAAYRFDVLLEDGGARVPDYGRGIDRLTARVRVTGRAGEAVSTLLALEAVSGPDVVHVDEGDVAVDLDERRWALKRLDVRVDAKAVGVRGIWGACERTGECADDDDDCDKAGEVAGGGAVGTDGGGERAAGRGVGAGVFGRVEVRGGGDGERPARAAAGVCGAGAAGDGVADRGEPGRVAGVERDGAVRVRPVFDHDVAGAAAGRAAGVAGGAVVGERDVRPALAGVSGEDRGVGEEGPAGGAVRGGGDGDVRPGRAGGETAGLSPVGTQRPGGGRVGGQGHARAGDADAAGRDGGPGGGAAGSF